ncbi:HYR-like domain-containing protein [Halocola ammonii]
MLDKYSLPTGWALPVGHIRPDSIAFTFFLALLFFTPFFVSASPNAAENGDDPQVIEVCEILGYQTENSRSFVIPEFGQFKASGPGLTLTRFDDNTAIISGTMEKVNQQWKKFEVELHFAGAFNYSEWIDLGYQAKGANLGDETSWIFYELDENQDNQLVGQGGLSGEILNVYNADPNYGLQIGQGANDKDSDFGFSWWFNYPNSQGHGDINADITCECPENGINFNGVPQDLVLNCGDELPVPSAVTAVNDAGESLEIEFSEFASETGAEEVCDLENGDQHAIWFSDDDVVGNNLNQRFDFVENGTFEQFPDGTARLTGTVENRNDYDARFSFTVWLKDASTYEEWTSIPNAASPTGFRQPKLDAGTSVDIDDQYLDWTYYEIDESKNNEFVGEGDLAGYNGTITHRPSNLRWGVQVGDRASLQSLGHGISFWFDVEGTNYHGDFNMSITDCEEQDEEFDCTDDYTIVRTWTATDNCGNMSSVAQTIEINGDNEAPTLDQSQIDFADCDIDLSQVEAAVSDNCDENPEVSVEIISVSNGSGGSSDDCQFRTQTPGGWGAPPNGNNPGAYLHANFEETFPNGVTIGCDNSFTFTTAQSITSFLPSGGQPSPLPAGNQVNPANYGNSFAGHVLSLSISVGFDNAIANFGDAQGNLSDAIVSGGPLSGMTVGEVLAEANAVIGGCDSDFSLSDLHETVTSINENYVDGDQDNGYVSCEYGGNECVFVYEIEVVAVDDCGNELNEIFTFEVEDNTTPELSETPADLTLECGEEIPTYEITASDNCDESVEVGFEEAIEELDCGSTITRTWTVTDDCGNSTTHTQTITIEDNEAPVLVGVPENQTGLCDATFEAAEVTATDYCDENVEVSVEETTNGEGCDYIITFTYTATDDCGNTATDSYSISVEDNEAPVLSETPADLTIECDEEIPSYEITATDNCNESVEVTFEESTQALDCGSMITRTWTATDDCGNSVEHTQTITIEDNENPVFVGVPQDLSINCDEEIPAHEVSATDNCDADVSITFNEVISEGCPYTITRTWTAADNCGNSVSQSQVITVIDEEAPVLVGVPEDISGDCGGAPEVADVSATDNCDDNVQVVFSEEVIGEVCPLTIVRTWTATDNCGNSVSASQTIEIDDETAPQIEGVPQNETVQCDAVPAVPQVTVSDNCDANPALEYTEEIIPHEPMMEGAEPCGYTIVRTWLATDVCGNTTTVQQEIEVEDTVAPELVGVPENTTVECGEIPEPVEVMAVDNCYEGEMEVLFTEEVIGAECGYQIVRTWTVEDNCWNYASQSQVITVEDNTAPILVGVPQNETIECDEEIAEAQVAATDNCDEDVAVSMDSETEYLACGYILIRTWTATDNCGNSSSATQVTTVIDEEAPVLAGVPQDATVACDQVPAAAEVSAEDNCSANVEVVFSEEISEGCPYTITRTWTATDDCDNSVSQSQVITVIDEEAPVLNGVPTDTTVECDQIPAVADVTALDNCTETVEVSFSESFDPADCGYVIVRTWSAEDLCGNEVIETQTITVVDSTNPTIVSQPEDLTLECAEGLPADTPVFTDNCDEELEVAYSEIVAELDCGQEVIQTWTAIDNCGNETSVSRAVTFIDTTAPVFVNVPEDASFECTQVPNAPELEVEDNCDHEVEVTFEESVEELDCGFIITRVWTAMDDCGNQTSVSQTVTAIDETAPVVLSVPEDATVECDEEVPNSTPEFTDNCTEDLSIETTSSIEQLDCGYLINKVWTATDECGNTTTVEQQITVIDTTAPEVISAPADITIECDEAEPTDEPVFTDNCDEELEVVAASSISELECGYQIEKTWTATDNCGNETTVSQLITVIDETAPTLIGVPENATVECEQVPAAAEVTANDNCDDQIEVTFTESIEELECGYIINRTWSASDDCGNIVEATQIITVEDNTNPELVGVPENVTVECDAIPEVALVAAQDNCDENLTVNVTESIEEQECGYLLIRTWAVHDDCGNSNSATQVITVEDTTAPVITSSPEDLNVECSAVPGFGQIEVEDNCDENLTIETSESQVSVECGYELTRTWTVTDDCGNTAVATQTILVADTTEPEIIGIPEDVTIECGEELPETPEVEFIDNCDPNPIYWITEEVELLDCGYQVIRIFRAVDECANENIQTWVITVTDQTAPVFGEIPADTTVQCGIDGPIPTVTATDVCDDEVEIQYSEEVSDGCPYTITRTWTAIDDCGNSSVATQVITVEDNEAPTFVNIEPLVNVECDEIGDFTVEAIDNCGEVEIGIQSELVFSGGCLGTIERVWIATDQCGNSTTYLQLIHIEDTTAPEIFNAPEDVTIDCGDEIPAVAQDVFAEDNCNDVEVIFDEEVSGEFCPYTITRTWTAIDDCGNMTQTEQVITVDVDVPEQQVDILAYPNPFNNKFTVTFSIPRDAQVKASIHDMTGKKMMDLYDGKANAWTLYEFNKTSNWDSGTYILHLVVDGEVHHHKLIVNNQ